MTIRKRIASLIIPVWVKPAIVLALIVLMYVLWLNWLSDHDEAISKEATARQAQQTAAATVDIAQDFTATAAEVAEAEQESRSYTSNVTRQQEKMRNENPSVNAWASNVIPIELRNADRAARLARNRSSDSESGSETASEAANR